jgi:hypothetical protein
MNKQIELDFATIVLIEKPCKEIFVHDEKVVTIANGWNITEVTVGRDKNRVKQRLIITVDRSQE